MSCLVTSLVGLAGLCFYFQLITEADNTRILTSPPQSPFRIGQRVRFTCEVDSTSTDNLTYQWKSVEYTDGWGFSYSGQSFNRTFHDYSLRYSWFFCSVWKNGTRIASSNKIVEVHGLLNTDDPVTKIFHLHQIILLQINNLSSDSQTHYSLSWYHNGTQTASNERMTISSNGTSLVISDMVESDAGKYEVKISSINYREYSSSPTCDINFLRMFEYSALHSPVTFYLQLYQIPKHKPEDIVKVYFLPVKSPTINPSYNITVNYTHAINISHIFGTYAPYIMQSLSRNGESQSLNRGNIETERSVDNEIFLSHHIRSNNTMELVGHYVYTEYSFPFDIDVHNCPGYYYYYNNYFITIVFIEYWTLQIEVYVDLQIDYLVLTNQPNRIECRVFNSPPTTLFLWHHRELLLETNLTQLVYVLTPYQFGEYTCRTSANSYSSLVREKASLQLLFHNISSVCCITDEDYYIALQYKMNSLCDDCNVSSDNFNKSIYINCPSKECTIFSADILYSNANGTVTSNTLIQRLQTWILSQNTPVLIVAGRVLSLDKECPTNVNVATKKACLNVIGEIDSPMTRTYTSTNELKTKCVIDILSPITGGAFALGMLFGIVVAIAIAIPVLTCCIKKTSKLSSQVNLNESAATNTDGNNDFPMKSNEAYETLPAQYEEVQFRYRRPQGDTNEYIYDQPAL